MWLAVASPEARRALQVIESLWERGLDEAALRCATTIVDLDSDVRVCPACTFEFPAGPEKCPECGLFLGG
jgi:hypothetical protein